MMYTMEVIQRKLTHSQCNHTIVINSLGGWDTYIPTHTHTHTYTHTDVHTETIVRNQGRTNPWPVHTWFKNTILCT